MKDQVLGLNISLLVHGIILAAFFTLGQGKMFENKPLVIDLSIVSRDLSSGAAVSSRKENRRADETPALPQKKVLISKTAPQSKSVPKLVPHRHPELQKVKPVSKEKTQPIASQTVDSEKTVPTFDDAPVTASDTPETPGNAGSNRSTPGVMTGLSSPGQNENNPENVARNYINTHFNYLRERLQKNLYYPIFARKMGWSGKILVGFTILKNGQVDDLEIKKSCGIKLLDNSAMETVRMACPFPEPPAVAKIVIPIMYTLN